MKDYEFIYSAIKLQVVYLNALAAGLLSSWAYLLQHTLTPTPRGFQLFIKMPFRPKRPLHNKPPAALCPPNPDNLFTVD